MDKTYLHSDILPDGLPKILPPSENGIFKAVMTLPEAYTALVDAVAAFLDRPVKSVALRNNDAPSRDVKAKQEEYDINCVVNGEDGDQCAVEMQATKMKGDSLLNDHENIRWRSVFNLCDLHSNQAGRGLDYSKFARSYQVVLCNYRVFSDDQDLVERYTFRTAEGKELCDAVTAILIDLTYAKDIAKKPVSKMSNLESWVVFFALASDPKYSSIITEITNVKEGIAVANETLWNISQSPEERARFRSRRIWLQDREHDQAVMLRELEEARAVMLEELEEARAVMLKEREEARAVMLKEREEARAVMLKEREEARAVILEEVRVEYEPLLVEKNAEIANKDAEIAALRAQLEMLQ